MKGKILIVDDEEVARTTVQRILRREGFDADVAATGEEAEAMLAANGYDVAIIDLRMPGVDGFAVLEWIQANRPEVVPVVLSGTSRIEEALKAVQRGAYDFVSKPVEALDVFVQHIRRAVEHKRLIDNNERLVEELRQKNVEIENRFSQLELAHSILQSQAIAIQIDLNRAMRIQHGLLPRTLPFANKISMAAVYHPMAKVGGDLYDVFQVGDHQIGIFIADTSGHGISSAMLTIFLKHAVQSAIRGPDSQIRMPGDILRELNRVLVAEAFGEGIFVSMAYLLIDLETLTMRYSSAGHPPLLLKTTGGAIQRLHKPAPVLGLNPNVAYTDEEVALHPLDVLVLYTDGITEARDVAGKYFGEERLKALLAVTENHADAIAGELDRQITAFCEGRQHTDDYSLVALALDPQRVPFRAPEEETSRPSVTPGRAGVRVLTAHDDGRLFISVHGIGSWRESQQILDLCEEAKQAGVDSVILDLADCTHLDSTFLGVLHNIATGFDNACACRFELQNLPRLLLQEMSDLGLSAVLMHFRLNAVPLPENMKPVAGGVPGGEEMGRLLLWAHEALVQADPSNADRFAAVLQVLHDQAKAASDNAEEE